MLNDLRSTYHRRPGMHLRGNAAGRDADGRSRCVDRQRGRRPPGYRRCPHRPRQRPATRPPPDRPTRAEHASRHCRRRSPHGRLLECPPHLRQPHQWRGHKCDSSCRWPLRHGRQCQPRKCRCRVSLPQRLIRRWRSRLPCLQPSRRLRFPQSLMIDAVPLSSAMLQRTSLRDQASRSNPAAAAITRYSPPPASRIDPVRRDVLLVAGEKSGGSQRRFHRALIRKADERFDRHLARLADEGGS